MSLDEHDYFKWFNDEITRYRNLEWRISAYIAGIFGVVVYWAYDPTRKNLIVNWRHVAFSVVFAVVAFCIFAEWHIHDRLNHYRAAQDLLRKNPADPEAALLAPYKLISSGRDGIYFTAFVLFEIIMGVAALVAVYHA